MEDMEEEDATSATPFDFKIKRAIFVEAEATKHWVEAGGVEEEVWRRRRRRWRRRRRSGVVFDRQHADDFTSPLKT